MKSDLAKLKNNYDLMENCITSLPRRYFKNGRDMIDFPCSLNPQMWGRTIPHSSEEYAFNSERTFITIALGPMDTKNIQQDRILQALGMLYREEYRRNYSPSLHNRFLGNPMVFVSVGEICLSIFTGDRVPQTFWLPFCKIEYS